MPDVATPPRLLPLVEPRRKVVTVVFSDVTGSTAMAERLDPEAIRTIMSRCFDRMRSILEAHGGTVEKFIGDAVMAVFGIPAVHEDDALRAVRAVEEIRRELDRLSGDLRTRYGVDVRFRTGVNTGEVIAGDPASGQSFATGDTVNVAARLEQAAAPGEVLLGERTWQLVRGAVVTEPVEPLTLKGKKEPLPAWRLVAVAEPVPVRPLAGSAADVPLVGRQAELDDLRAVFAATLRERRCRVVTVIGPAGIGKSRLVDEFAAGTGPDARVLRGHCLSYGAGITFWPVQEMVKAAAGISGTDSAAEAMARLGELVTGDDHRPLLANRVAQVLGLAPADAPIQEIFWAVRRLLEILARHQPLVVVFEDLHWAEPTLLDLVEYLAGFSQEAPVLIVVTARPELFDARPRWAPGEPAVTMRLEPLPPDDADRLVDEVLGSVGVSESVRRCVTEVAEGNPLFVAEVVRMLVDDGRLRRDGGVWRLLGLDLDSVPPTLDALLAARLDRLPDEERAVLQRGAVVGRSFWWGAVAELSPPEVRPGIGRWLQSLVRKEVIAPEATSFAGEDAFRFGHALLRDAAYRGTSKEVRAELHERFADWLTARAGERLAEYEEILGYHLEHAYRLRSELGSVTELELKLADRAATHLAAAGHRALGRGDATAAAGLLKRVMSLWPRAHAGRVEAALGFAEAAQLFTERMQAVDEALDGARELKDERLEWRARLWRARLRMWSEPGQAIAAAQVVAEEAISALRDGGDADTLAMAFHLLAMPSWFRGQAARADDALRRAAEHARVAAGSRYWRLLGMRAWLLPTGPVAVPEAKRRCLTFLDELAGQPGFRESAVAALAMLEAMAARFDDAHRLLAEANELGRQFGGGNAPLAQAAGRIEIMAGHFAAAATTLEDDCRQLRELGDLNLLSTSAAYLAQALVPLGRHEEAYEWTETSEQSADADDILSQVVWRGARAKILAGRGELREAERLARQAIDLSATTDWLSLHGEAHLDLARVLRHNRGSADAARAAAGESRAIFSRKENLAGVAAVDEFVGQLSQPTEH